MPELNLPDFLDVETICLSYGVSDDTVTGWIRDGELVAFKLSKKWLVHPDDWSDFIDRRRQAAAAGVPKLTRQAKPTTPLRAS